MQIKKAMNYMCADAGSVFPTWQVKKLKVKWLKDRLIYKGITNEGEITVTPVTISTDYHQKKYMMDCVTGTLYKDGKCMTSDHLKLLDVVEEDGLAKHLMTLRAKALGG